MQQTTFLLATNHYRKSDFICSSANELPYNTIENWPKFGWGVNPYPKSLIIQGPKSSGKTFLAYNWLAKAKAQFIDLNQNFNSELIHQYDAFIIDDIDNVSDEKKLLHYFNMLNECDKYLLMTCTKSPEIILSDLDSRIKATNIIKIESPDDMLIEMLIFKFFANYSIKITPEIINYLINNLPRRFDAIIESLEKINQYALENKHKITIPLIKKAVMI